MNRINRECQEVRDPARVSEAPLFFCELSANVALIRDTRNICGVCIEFCLQISSQVRLIMSRARRMVAIESGVHDSAAATPNSAGWPCFAARHARAQLIIARIADLHTKAEYICADLCSRPNFPLQSCGGPHIPITDHGHAAVRFRWGALRSCVREPRRCSGAAAKLALSVSILGKQSETASGDLRNGSALGNGTHSVE